MKKISKSLCQWVVKIAKEGSYGSVEQQLYAMTDKELNDMGICRGEIPNVVRNGRKK